ncbi:MAG: UDP-3-O-(3-hydroxymyristoyl)glucosamine N-acyltransferase [Coxiella sp. RIFCSPHIGHO2_12_FULL_42_15]|nr:MAG: UDP-3-O-(3-hydroxymyristoyl)glucosamine N-acyltransferase [Coxiella sp. RIFCSPHIGHO2_12_FULL_42_15]
MITAFTLDQLASKLHAELHGDAACQIVGVASLEQARHGCISFVEGRKQIKTLATTQASAVLLTADLLPHCSTNALVVKKPRLAFAALLNLLYPVKQPAAGIHPSSVIGKACHIDPSVTIKAHVVIGDGVSIGKNSVIHVGCSIGDGTDIGEACTLHPNVSIYQDIEIGHRVIVHSGAVIGADGFGFEFDGAQEWVKLLQIGRVVIGDDVEIGANTTIDRGALGDTLIGCGVKLDNQIMVAHNVVIGDHTIIAGCTGIAGSTIIGRYCMIGGHTAIAGHIKLADRVMITGAAMVTRSIMKPGIYSSGTGILPNQQWLKSAVRFKQLENMYQRLQKLERKIHDDHDNG